MNVKLSASRIVSYVSFFFFESLECEHISYLFQFYNRAKYKRVKLLFSCTCVQASIDQLLFIY